MGALVGSELEDLVARLDAAVSDVPRWKQQLLADARLARNAAAEFAAMATSSTDPQVAWELRQLSDQARDAARQAEGMAESLRFVDAGATHFRRRVVAGAPAASGPVSATSSVVIPPASSTAGDTAEDGEAVTTDADALAGQMRAALPNDQYYLRRHEQEFIAARRRIVDEAGDPVAPLAWDTELGAWVEVEGLVRARYQGQLEVFDGLSTEQRAALDASAAERAAQWTQRRAVLAADPEAPAQEQTAARRALTEASERLGEVAADVWVMAQYGDSAEKVYTGQGPGVVDAVYKITDPGSGDERYVVIEHKGGSSELGAKRIGGTYYQQGTRTYLDDTVESMRRRSRRVDPQARAMGAELRIALDLDAVEYVHVEAPMVADGEVRIKVGTFDISDDDTETS